MDHDDERGGRENQCASYAGSALPSQRPDGEVDIVHVSVGEALQYMQAKKLRPSSRASRGTEIPGVGKVQPITDFYPELKKCFPCLSCWASPFLWILQGIKDELTKALMRHEVRRG